MVEDEDKYAPKPRGGGRATGALREKKRRTKKRAVSEASLANLRPRWQPGQSGNPSGKPQSLIEITKLARALSPAAIAKLNEILHDPETPPRDQVAAARELLDRGLGRPFMAVLHGQGGASPPELTEDGTPVSALLAAARRNGESYEAELRRELARIEQDKAQKKADFEAEITEASRAQANGAEIDPMMRLLLQVRDEAE